jgi:hypothetical protein
VSFTPLTDEEFALLKSIPDVTNREDIDGNLLRLVCETSFTEDEYNAYNMTAWMRAWHHADYLNEKHNEDHISFCVVKSCQVSYVLDKQIARRYKLIP